MPTEPREICAIGQITGVDAEGYIINPCAKERIVSPWRDAVDAVVSLCRRSLGPSLHSIYLRGSVPRGGAIEGISDIDAVCILSGPPPVLPERWPARMERVVMDRHPCCAGVELRVLPLRALMHAPEAAPLRFLLKTQGLCEWGTDLSANLPTCTLADARIALNGLGSAIAQVRDLIEHSPAINTRGVSRRCLWISKKIVRAGFELVASSERAYTRDLYPCWEAFARHHPPMVDAMKDVLYLAINPTSDRERIARCLDTGERIVALDRRTEPHLN